jgi:uncharacterized repeat protein (TIGR01451 family)
VITQPVGAVTAEIKVVDVTQPSCEGNIDGEATVTVSGGTGLYTYLWSDGQSTATASGLTAGYYTVTVTDANGCTAQASILLSDPTGITATITAVTHNACYGDLNGSATVTGTGGIGGYTYLWSNGQTNATATGLAAGNYTVTVSDGNSCTATAFVEITQPAALNILLVSQTNVDCNGNSTGSMVIDATGGVAPYTFTSDPAITFSGNTAMNLAAGSYDITVTDAHLCTDAITVVITQPANALAATTTVDAQVLCFGASTGSATVNPTGGTAPYTYLWSNGSTDKTATNLSAGTYTVDVLDANGCTTSTSAVITQPVGAITANAGVDATICSSDVSYTLSATASNQSSVLWITSGTGNFDNDEILDATYTPSLADINDGQIELTLNAYGDPSCSVVSNTMVLVIWQTATAYAGRDVPVCVNQPYFIDDAHATNFVTTEWTIVSGGGLLSGANTLAPTYTPADNYTGAVTLRLTVIPVGNCGPVTDEMIITYAPCAIYATNDNSSGNTPGDVVTVNILANDTLFDGTVVNPLDVSVDLDPLTPGDQTTLVVAGEGTWEYDEITGDLTFTPEAGFTTDPTPITYILTQDSTGLTDTAVVTIDYTEGNPTANDDTNVIPGTPGNNVTIDILDNDKLSDGSQATTDNTSVQLIDPATGNPTITPNVVVVQGEGTWSYDPATGIVTFNPLPGFTADPTDIGYILTENSTGLTDQATITVNYTQEPPVANDDTSTGNLPGTSTVIDILTNDYLADGTPASPSNSYVDLDPSTPGIQTQLIVAGEGTWSYNVTTGDLTFTPEPGFTGSPSDIIYTLIDKSSGESDTASVHVEYATCPVASAGPDVSICESEIPFTVTGSSASNYSTIQWLTDGTGTFEDATSLHPVYHPSDSDIADVQVILTMIATGDPVCDPVADAMVLTIWQQPTADAGPDATLCEGELFELCCASAEKYASLLWTTSGTGTFDNPNTLLPTYTPSGADLNNGSVVLTLTALSNTPCANASDSRTLYLVPQATADAGPDQQINGQTTATMAANTPVSGTGLWTQIYGPTVATIDDPASSTTTLSDLIDGTYFFRWTLTNPPCDPVWDDMMISNAPMADLSIIKTATPEPVLAGENVTYTITVTNNGPATARFVKVQDVLPAGLTLISNAISTGSWIAPFWYIGPLNNGVTETMTIVAKVDANYIGSITNTATVSSTTLDPDPTNNTDEAVTTVIPLTDLAIVKTCQDIPVAGGMVVYQLLITNNGPGDAADVSVSDILPAVLSSGDYSIDGGANWNTWISPMTIGTLAAGDNYSFSIRGLLASSALNSVSNTATVTTTTPESDLSNNTSTITTPITTQADLCIIKTGPATAVPGEMIEWSFYVCAGISDALLVKIVDIIPPEVTGAEYSIDGGINWLPWTGSLEIGTVYGGQPFEFLMRATVNANVTGDIINTATVTSITPDPDPTNNTDTEITPVTPSADLVMQKTGPAEVTAGEQIVWTLTVSNAGPSDAHGVFIQDMVVTEVSNVEVSTDLGANWLPWISPMNMGDLAAGASIEIRLRGMVAEGYAHLGNLTNIATVGATTPDPDPENNADTAVTVVEVPPVANDDISTGNVPGQNAVVNLLSNDLLGDGTTTPQPGDVVLDIDPSTPGVQTELVVPGEGTWAYDPITGDLTFSPEAGFVDDPTPITYTITETLTGLTSNIATVTVLYECITIQAKVFLEGPYDPTTGLMENFVRFGGMLPGDKPLAPVTPTPAGQPYQGAPWNYNDLLCNYYGDPSVNPDAVKPYPADVVDWVLVSIRQGDSLASSTIFRCVGLVARDGTVTLECPCFRTAGVDKYYIIIDHRNHLQVMSKVAHLNGGTTLGFDFTIQDSWKLGTPIPQEVGQKLIGNHYVMVGGNGDQTHEPSSQFDLNSLDFDVWARDNGILFRYLYGDYDMNLDANSLDDELWINNNGKINFIPR